MDSKRELSDVPEAPSDSEVESAPEELAKATAIEVTLGLAPDSAKPQKASEDDETTKMRHVVMQVYGATWTTRCCWVRNLTTAELTERYEAALVAMESSGAFDATSMCKVCAEALPKIRHGPSAESKLEATLEGLCTQCHDEACESILRDTPIKLRLRPDDWVATPGGLCAYCPSCSCGCPRRRFTIGDFLYLIVITVILTCTAIALFLFPVN